MNYNSTKSHLDLGRRRARCLYAYECLQHKMSPKLRCHSPHRDPTGQLKIDGTVEFSDQRLVLRPVYHRSPIIA